MDSNHRSRRERDGRGGGGSRPTIVVSRDDLCLMTPVQLIGPAGNSRETLFAKSGTDGSNPVPSSGESGRTFVLRPRLVPISYSIELRKAPLCDRCGEEIALANDLDQAGDIDARRHLILVAGKPRRLTPNFWARATASPHELLKIGRPG